MTEALPLDFADCIAVPLEGTTVLGEEAARSVRRFCELVEAGSPTAGALALSMAALHLAALALPDLDGEHGAPDPAEPPATPPVTLPVDVYWDVFDPLEMTPAEPVANSLYDDVADVWRDLRRGLDLFDRGFPAAACWSWRFHFGVHWGEHLVGAQRALFLAIRQGG